MTAIARHDVIDKEAILQHLKLSPRDVNTQALLLICHRYGLDPLLKHVVLIQGRPYITRDGYLAVAHASQQLDGIEVLDEGEDETHWWAKVAVHRKDMGRPFSYRGRYPKTGSGNKEYGPEMAVKCSEVASLRRAFNVTGAGAADERWDDPGHVVAPTPETYAGVDDAGARELGWSSLAELRAEHLDYVAWAETAGDGEKGRAKAHKTKIGAGWPMSPDQMREVVAAAHADGLPDVPEFHDTNPEDVAYDALQRRYGALLPKRRKRVDKLASDALLCPIAAAVDAAEQASWSKLLDVVEAEQQAENPAFPEGS